MPTNISVCAVEDMPTPLPLLPDLDGNMRHSPYYFDESEMAIVSVEETAVQLALSSPYVTHARAFEYDGCTIVAVLTTPFYLKSERDSFRAELEQQLVDAVGNAVVTLDMEVYRNITENMSEETLKRLAEKALRT